MNREQRASLFIERNELAEAAYEKALAPARRPLSDPERIPYPDAVRTAMAAFDAVIADYRGDLWPDDGDPA